MSRKWGQAGASLSSGGSPRRRRPGSNLRRATTAAVTALAATLGSVAVEAAPSVAQDPPNYVVVAIKAQNTVSAYSPTGVHQKDVVVAPNPPGTNPDETSTAAQLPEYVAISPDGNTAYVTDSHDFADHKQPNNPYLSIINLQTGSLETNVAVGTKPQGVAVSPDGKTVLVGNGGVDPPVAGGGSVSVVDTATQKVTTTLTLGDAAHLDQAMNIEGVAFTPDGRTAYACDYGTGNVFPIDMTQNPPSVGQPFSVGSDCLGVAITPDGQTGIFTKPGDNVVMRVNLANPTQQVSIPTGTTPQEVAITPDGSEAWVTNTNSGNLTVVHLAGNSTSTVAMPQVGSPPVNQSPLGVAITPDGKTAWVSDASSVGAQQNGHLTPVTVSTLTPGAPVNVGSQAWGIAITPDQAPQAAFSVGTASAGQPSHFDASASHVAFGTVTNYHWNFGDGQQADTATATTAHTYGTAGNYTATLTETDSAGTSTTQVYTGETLSRNGGPSAQASQSFQVPSAQGSGGAGYRLVAADGGVFSFNAAFYGSLGNLRLNQPIVGATKDPATGGYWMVAADGGVFSFNAPFYGSMGSVHLNQPVVGMAATPSGNGYWLVAADGGVFSFGDALFHGSTGGMHLNQPVVGMAATASGHGYWMVARDGGIFSFGDAVFHGSMGGTPLNKPVVGMSATKSGGGYWMVASDGGVFTFGDAGFFGSTGNIVLNQPVVGMTSDPDTGGYWMVASDGGVFAFNAAFLGSMGGTRLNQPVVGMTAS